MSPETAWLEGVRSFAVELPASRWEAPPTALIEVFHRFIRERRPGELLIDVADYSHVADGPWVLLVGHERDTGVHRTSGRFRLQVREKRLARGLGPDALRAAFAAAARAAVDLVAAPELAGRCAFGAGLVRVVAHDRLAAPPGPATTQALSALVREALGPLLPGLAVDGDADADPRNLPAVRALWTPAPRIEEHDRPQASP